MPKYIRFVGNSWKLLKITIKSRKKYLYKFHNSYFVFFVYFVYLYFYMAARRFSAGVQLYKKGHQTRRWLLFRKGKQKTNKNKHKGSQKEKKILFGKMSKSKSLFLGHFEGPGGMGVCGKHWK